MFRRLSTAARLLLQIAVVVCAGAVGVLVNTLVINPGHGMAPTPAQAQPVDPAALTVSAQRLARQTATGSQGSIIATARGTSVRVYARPQDGSRSRLLDELPDSYGTKLVFLVERRAGAWLKVQLPVRPNRSSGWIKASAVTVNSTGLQVVVNLTAHRLTVWNGTHVVMRAPVGVGRSVSPTPSGRYFIADLLEPPNPHGVFGAYAFGLSAYSDVYTSFAGGDGQIGLHGTDDPGGIGTDVSHGCIRTYNSVITRLAGLLPLGTPVTITRTRRR